MKLALSILGAVAMTALSAEAFVIKVAGNNFFTGVSDSGGTLYNNTSNQATLRFGFFTTTGTAAGALLNNTQITALGANPAALQAAFVEIGSSTNFESGTQIGTPALDANVAESTNAGPAAPFPLNRPEYDAFATGGAKATGVYGMVTNTGNSEVGVWQSTTLLRAAGGLSDFDATTTVDFYGATVTSIFGLNNIPGTPNAGQQGLRTITAIPEPSAFGLLALSVGALALRRKRA